MLNKIILFIFCYLTIVNGKTVAISSNKDCYVYHNDNNIEINCNGNKITINDSDINRNLGKGKINGQSLFVEIEARFSKNNNFVIIPTFGDPTKGAGINGTDKDNLYEIVRVNTKTKEIKVIVRRKDIVDITNYFDFNPEQIPGIKSGEIIPLNYGVDDNGTVIFYADIISVVNGTRSIVKRGYFKSTPRDNEFYQINTFARSLFNSHIYPETYNHPVLTDKGFYYTFIENGIGKMVFYEGFERGKNNVEVGSTSTTYGDEKISLPTRIIQFNEKTLWGNIYPSLYTITADTKKQVFTSRFFNFNTSVSDIFLYKDNLLFATTRNFEEKDPWKNNSIYVVLDGKTYKIISSGEITQRKTVGVISRNIFFDRINSKIIFISNGDILEKNVNIVESVELKDGIVFIKGLFPDLNLERGIQVLINGVVVVPEGTIPPSLRANKNEISFNIPANISGKQKIDIVLSTINGPVGAINNGIEFEFPKVPVELNLFGENHREVAPGEEINVNINSNVLGKFSITAEDANGIRPVNIISSGNSRNLNISVKVLVNTKFTIKFISVNGEEKEISVFVEVMPPKISFLTSTREDQKIFSGDEIYVSGENLSPNGEEMSGNNENLKVKINDIECEVIFISPSVLQIKVPDFEVVDEEENWLVISVFGRETAIKIKINKKEIENDPPMRK